MSERIREDIRAVKELLLHNMELARKITAALDANDANDAKTVKGSLCSVSGANYELAVWKVCRRVYYSEQPFCVMSKSELAGSGSGFDLTCWFAGVVVPIEIKRNNAPDWGQVSIEPHTDTGWRAKRSKHSKTTSGVQDIFDAFLVNARIFDGKIPPPMIRDTTHSEWLAYKKKHSEFSDQYIRDCPHDLISQIYAAKHVEYIQVSKYGLFHTGNNPCGFTVPKFSCPTRLRIRVKVHSRCNARGFVHLSVTCAAQPVIADLPISAYSLDDIDRVPPPPPPPPPPRRLSVN